MKQRQQGFSYMVALFLVAVVSVLSVRVFERTLTNEQRDREAELLWVGQAYRTAIGSYYEKSPGSSKQYPPDLPSLLQDMRATTMSRPLRTLYLDPISGSANWGTVPAPNGGVMGVYSLSTKHPIKVGGFPAVLSNFIGATNYQGWQFIYLPG